MDFASPVAPSIAGEQTDSFSTGKTFATWTFNKAKFPSFTNRQAHRSIDARMAGHAGMDSVVRYREEHHPSASGEGPSP